MRTTRIGIIGGGASGLTAAIAAKRACPGADIFILEHKDTAGKKILATGNGRCNLTNEQMDAAYFHSNCPGAVKTIIERFGVNDTLSFFSSLGILTRSRGGYIYPRSSQASAVLSAFLTELRYLGVHIYPDTHVTDIVRKKNGFQIIGKDKSYAADKVILAAGGRASGALGSDGSGYTLAKKYGHTIEPVVPALVQLKVKNHPFAKAAGVRTDAKVTAIIDGMPVNADTGELQLTAYGISGIPVFQISRYAALALYEGKQVAVEVDFLPDCAREAFSMHMAEQAKRRGYISCAEAMEGIFQKKLVPVLLKQAGIHSGRELSALNDKEIASIASICKKQRLLITDTNGFEHAQVCAGGVSLSEVASETLESKKQKDLYITGELLDTDGVCGGYNLQWAWATGMLAGTHAAAGKEYRAI